MWPQPLTSRLDGEPLASSVQDSLIPQAGMPEGICSSKAETQKENAGNITPLDCYVETQTKLVHFIIISKLLLTIPKHADLIEGYWHGLLHIYWKWSVNFKKLPDHL